MSTANNGVPGVIIAMSLFKTGVLIHENSMSVTENGMLTYMNEVLMFDNEISVLEKKHSKYCYLIIS